MMKKTQLGNTLIEILISFIIMALGLMGIAGLLVLSLKANISNVGKQKATAAVHNIIDKIRANPQAAINGYYNVDNLSGSTPVTPGVLCTVSTCTTTQLASYDTWDWLVNDVAKLPNGKGSIQVTPNASNTGGNLSITIQWDDSQIQSKLGRIAQPGVSSSSYVSMTMQTQL